jgi:N-acetylmuramoyl-L-alanine amidase
MLLFVRRIPRLLRWMAAAALCVAIIVATSFAAIGQSQTPGSNQSSAPAANPVGANTAPVRSVPTSAAASNQATAHMGLNIVVLDPAHGGVDLGARGTEGVRESEVVLLFAAQVKRALEAQAFQVIMTREGNENPSFDDRSARANSQRGAIFITLHIASTGLAGTVHTYVMPDSMPAVEPGGLIPWERAQAPFVGLSRKLGDLVQAEMASRFKGSPSTAHTAPVRQLRTTAAPAIAVEISSVAVRARSELDRMIPGVADAITHGVVAFRPSYVLANVPGTGGQP